jgi:hypothetical protein
MSSIYEQICDHSMFKSLLIQLFSQLIIAQKSKKKNNFMNNDLNIECSQICS